MPESGSSFPWSVEKTRQYAYENTRKVEVKGHYGSRLGIWLLVSIVRSLSRKSAWGLGGWIGRLMYRFKIRRDVVMTNLEIVYADKKSPEEKEAIYKGCLVNIGRQVANYLRTPLYDEKFWAENVTMKGEPIVRDAFNKGKGVIILSMHYGAWELPGGKFGMSGYPISNIIKIIKNPATEKLLIDARLAMNLGTIPHKNSAKRIHEGLARGEGIIMAVDQNMKRSQGVFVDWFGHTASTIRSCAYLARETGAAVVAGYSRQPDADHIEVIVLGEIPWVSHPEDPEKELLINTRNYIAPFEKPIYDEPEGWLWLHRRWKVQPEGEPNTY
jgi:Kdo2-lipid IVA lauroyltransferase/acyltransferase